MDVGSPGARHPATDVAGSPEFNWWLSPPALAREGRPASLDHADGQERWQGASLVASEPLDDGPGWRHVEPGSFVIANGRGHRCEPIRIESAGGSRRAK